MSTKNSLWNNSIAYLIDNLIILSWIAPSFEFVFISLSFFENWDLITLSRLDDSLSKASFDKDEIIVDVDFESSRIDFSTLSVCFTYAIILENSVKISNLDSNFSFKTVN